MKFIVSLVAITLITASFALVRQHSGSATRSSDAGVTHADEQAPQVHAPHSADAPVFPLDEQVARNHLIVVGMVDADAGTREYGRINYKSEGGSPPDSASQAPGLRTVLRTVAVERTVKGALPPGTKTILVEELTGVQVAAVGGRYLFLLSPWHNDTYQAGVFGAVSLTDSPVSFASGESGAVGLATLAGLSPDDAVKKVAAVVEAQREQRVGTLAIVRPMAGRPYNIAHMFSLAGAESVTVDGRPIEAAALAELRAQLEEPAFPAASSSTALKSLVIQYASGQHLQIGLDTAMGQLVVPGDNVGVGFSGKAKSILR